MQPIVDLAACDIFAAATGIGRIVDAEEHVQRGFIYGDAGNADNASLQPYVGLEDGAEYDQVQYSPISDIQLEEWIEWNIPLSDYSGLTTLTSIDNIYIGLGQRGSGTVGSLGQIFIDDVRLYPPKCVPEFGPDWDFSGNCIVDLLDIGIMARDWLRTDAQLDVSAPPTAPVAHWELDDLGTVATDTEVGHDGDLEGEYTWVTGRVGSGAVEFSGDQGGRVRVPHSAELMPSSEVSATAWIYPTVAMGYSARVVTKGTDAGNWEAYNMQFNGQQQANWSIRDPNHTIHGLNSGDLYINEWIHIAGTYDSNVSALYVNGQVVDQATIGDMGGSILQDVNDLSIGNASDVNDRAFIGMIDDVRVYNYGLTAPEVAYVATAPAYDGYVALTAQTNIYDEELAGEKAVNFRDLAELMTVWLEEKLYPE